eukprot:8347718-Alexandrium_andersonii.AAC.1
MRASARAVLASPASRSIAAKRARHTSERLGPTAHRRARTRARIKHPAARPCPSESSRIKITRRGAGATRGRDGG